MHEPRVDTDLSAVLLALILVVLVTLGVFHHSRVRSQRQVELRRIQQIIAENERVEKLAEEEYSSMLSARNPSQSLCAVCQTPTNTRCSRCKAVHYCSPACQLKHWKEGHKTECRGTKPAAPAAPVAPVSPAAAVQATKRSETTYDVPITGQVNSSTRPVQVEVWTSNTVSNVNPDGSLVKPKKILFPYNQFVHYFNWPIRRPPCGLINCGNSCFANVILQCLTFTRPLAAYLLEGNHQSACLRNDWCFMCELQEHTQRAYHNQMPFSPLKILSRLRDIAGNFGYGRQEDAHEFMRFAVDSMQSICLDQFGGEKRVDSRSQETTLVQYIFGGHLRSQVKCITCGHESNRYENMMDLAVEIQGAVESLEDGLAQFTAPEWLDGDNKYKCDKCNDYVKARKHLTIHEAPNILTIALKRFQFGKFGKLNKKVTFPEILNMLPYMSGEGDKPPLYRLYAVVVHIDMLNASFFGHYICYIRAVGDRWFKVDDNKVKEVDIDKVLSQGAYMLMYTRSSPRPGPEPATGSVASSLTDVSVSHGRECSSASCKYQRSTSIGQIHGEFHQVSPIIAGTVANGPLAEELVGPSCSTVSSTRTSSQELAEGSCENDITDDGKKSGKRRLEVEAVVPLPGLARTRSASCPPPAGRSPLPPVEGVQLADDLPRTFGYSLCGREAGSPSKRQHLLEDGDDAASLPVSMDVDVEMPSGVQVETAAEAGSPSLVVENGTAGGGTSSSSICMEIGSTELETGETGETVVDVEQEATSTSPASEGEEYSVMEAESESKMGVEMNGTLKPVFAKGFLDRGKKVVASGDNSTRKMQIEMAA